MVRGWPVIMMACAAPAAAQGLELPPVTYPGLPAQAQAAEGFVPAGWRLETQAQGDLNGDGVADRALVLRENDPRNLVAHDLLGENPLDTNPRILAVVFGKPGGGYRLVLADHALIPRRDSPTLDDPFDSVAASGIAIGRGALKITLGRFASAGSWEMGSTTFTFRWQEGHFRLIGYDDNSTQRNSGATTMLSINYLTGKVKLAQGSIDSDKQAVSWTRLPSAAPVTLEDVGDGLAFQPERRP